MIAVRLGVRHLIVQYSDTVFVCLYTYQSHFNCVARWARVEYSTAMWNIALPCGFVGIALLVSDSARSVLVHGVNFCWYDTMELELSPLDWSMV